jgi:hypothetical protein
VPPIAFGGRGASADAPGTGGCSGSCSQSGIGPLSFPGLLATGGTDRECAGVGGGGRFGGGAGFWHAGGGAGSSFTGGLTNLTGGDDGGSAASIRSAGGANAPGYIPGIGVGGDMYASGGDGAVILTWCVAAAPTCAAGSQPVTTRFAFNSDETQEYTVPAGAASVRVKLWGAGGSGGRFSPGGGGAFVEGVLSGAPAAPGARIAVLAGAAGLPYPFKRTGPGGSPAGPDTTMCCGTGAGPSALSYDGGIIAVAGAGGSGGETAGCGGGAARWDGASNAAAPSTGPNGRAVIEASVCPGTVMSASGVVGGFGASAFGPGARGCGSTAQTSFPFSGTGPLPPFPRMALLSTSTALRTGSQYNVGSQCGGLGGGGFYGGGGGGWHDGGGAGSSFFNSTVFNVTFGKQRQTAAQTGW